VPQSMRDAFPRSTPRANLHTVRDLPARRGDRYWIHAPTPPTTWPRRNLECEYVPHRTRAARKGTRLIFTQASSSVSGFKVIEIRAYHGKMGPFLVPLTDQTRRKPFIPPEARPVTGALVILNN